jgi:hypothetical protein
MIRAVCLRCGSKKRQPWQRCAQCGFDPNESESALVKSVYLSTRRFEEPERTREYSIQLEEFSERLRNGLTIDFEPAELARLTAQHELVKSIPLSAAAGVLFRLFLPGIVFLVSLFTMGAIIRRLHLPVAANLGIVGAFFAVTWLLVRRSRRRARERAKE